MKPVLIAAAAALLLPLSAWSQMGGMGGGMMGGYGAGGMGGGMMGGYGGGGGYGGRPAPGYEGQRGPGAHDNGQPRYRDANLSGAQRAKIAAIEQSSARRQAVLQKEIGAQERRLDELYASGDDAGARKAYETLSEKRKQLFEESLDARRRVDVVLGAH